MQNRVYSLLGLATRGSNTKSGGFQTKEAITYGRAALVILTEDAGPNTIDEIQPACERKGIPLRYYGTKEELGHAMGKELRSCAAVTDPGLAQAILKAIDEQQQVADAT